MTVLKASASMACGCNRVCGRFASKQYFSSLMRTQSYPSISPQNYNYTSSNNNSNNDNNSNMSSYDEIPSDIAALVDKYAAQSQTTESLQQIIQSCDIMANTCRGSSSSSSSPSISPLSLGRFGKRLASERVLMTYAQALKNELPIRLAHRIQDLDKVPQLRNMPSVQAVKGLYIHSFLELLQIEEPNTPILEEQFGTMLQELYQNHSQVLLQMAMGAWEFKSLLRQKGKIPLQGAVGGKMPGSVYDPRIRFAQQEECHQFLDRFYMSRVGIRVMAGQYLALRQQLLEDVPPMNTIIANGDGNDNSGDGNGRGERRENDHSKYIGMICQECSPYETMKIVIQDATQLCQAQYGQAPHVRIEGQIDLTFPYLPTHLHYIMLELVKNAMRATMEFHSDSILKPDVVVIIAHNDDNEDVVIKVADEGGGIPRSQMEHIWSYLYTSVNPAIQETFLEKQRQRMLHEHSSSTSENSPILAGLGYGLPMSRAYARYFGGELDIISMEGYGTDAFCYLVRLGDKAPVPV